MRRQPPSFAGAVFVHRHCFRSWAVTFVGGWSSSPLFMGIRLHSWVIAFVRGWLCRLYGVVVGVWFICGSSSSQVVVPLVGCSVGVLVGCGGGGKLVCGGGCWWGVVAGHWCVVVAGPCGHSWWSSRVWHCCCGSVEAPGGMCNRCRFVLLC